MHAVLFDLDGVLIDSYGAWLSLTRAGAIAFGCPPVTEQAYAGSWGQSVQADAAQFFPGVPLVKVQAWLEEHYMEHVHRVEVDRDARRVIASLRSRDVRVAVCTNTPQPLAGRIVERLELAPETVVGETDVPRAKPAPDMLEEALRRLEVPAENAWMVGDSRFDAQAAQAAGVRFAGLRREGRVRLETLAEVLEALA